MKSTTRTYDKKSCLYPQKFFEKDQPSYRQLTEVSFEAASVHFRMHASLRMHVRRKIFFVYIYIQQYLYIFIYIYNI